jgi:hypothetical protein
MNLKRYFLLAILLKLWNPYRMAGYKFPARLLRCFSSELHQEELWNQSRPLSSGSRKLILLVLHPFYQFRSVEYFLLTLYGYVKEQLPLLQHTPLYSGRYV